MAYTVSFLARTVSGNQRAHEMRITADAATGNVNTYLNFVDSIVMAPHSMTTAGAKLFINVGALSTTLVGYLGCSGLVSGDVFHVIAYGH